MEKVRRHIIFHGYVQGVGFRHTACNTARNYGISGWVRNLDDGSVEMEAEGRARDIDALVDSLENLRWGSVDRIETKNIPVHGDYEFEIVWYKDMDLSPICLPNLKKREKKHIKLRKNKAGSAI